MKYKLKKSFGIHKKGDTLEVNDRLKKHLLASGHIEIKKASKKK